MKKESSKEEEKSEEKQEELAEPDEEKTKEASQKQEEAQGETAEHKEEIAEKALGKELKEKEEAPEEAIETEKAELPAAEEEAKPKREEKAEAEEEEIVEERIYTVPLSKAWIKPANKRAPKAMRMLKKFLVKHMKLEAPKEGEEEEEPAKLIVSNEVNERIWSRGIEKPPRKIRIRATRDKDGNVTVYLAEGD